MSIYKTCDIRGIAGKSLTVKVAQALGNATVQVLKAQNLVLGHDMRKSSDELCQAFITGATDAGCDIVNIGLVPTEICYFAISHLSADGGVMITASHNPAEYNGMKFCSANSFPVDYAGGIGEIQALVEQHSYYHAATPGYISTQNLFTAYINHCLQFAPNIKRMTLVADTGNGMAGTIMPHFVDNFKTIDFIPLFWELDGTFPNRGPNPLAPASTERLCKKVIEDQADLGIAFDGDADRLVFIDEKGTIVKPDVILMLLAELYLEDNPGSTIVYDQRCSRAVPEFISNLGGVPVQSKVGHTNVKKTMRKYNAIFAGELSGHYYFQENYFSDASSIALLKVLGILSSNKTSLSKITENMSPYFSTGEISYQVADQEAMIEKVRSRYSKGEYSTFDGLTINYPDWWLNIRPSITEPYLRLNLECNSAAKLETLQAELQKVITNEL